MYYRQGFFEHHEPVRAITTNAANSSGNATGYMGPCPAGYCWYLENLTLRIADNGVLDLFVVPEETVQLGTAWDMNGRFDHFAAATDDVRNYGTPIFVPAGYFIVASLSGATSGDRANLSMQIAVHQLNPAALTSFPDQNQIRESHEHPTSPQNVDAVGARAV